MTGNIKSNERELAGKVAQWFNDHIARNQFPFTSATNETGISVDKSTYFGDVIIWKNIETREAYSYIELKPPFGTLENLERFRKKAIELKIKIAYTWNFQQLNAYKIDKNKIELLASESNRVLININDWLRGDIQAQIRTIIYKICEELLNIELTGKFKIFKPDKFYFIQFLRNTVTNLIPVYEEFIKNEYRKKESKDKINKYVIEQGIAYPSDDEFFKLIAGQSVYGLVTKIIFYLTIKRYFKDLPDLIHEDSFDINRSLHIAFAEASALDWQSVFIEGAIEQMGVPDGAINIITDLFAQLKVYNFGELPEDVVGELFEELIDPEHRHTLGQYFTREDLVDFIIATIVDNPDKVYCDPTCGSGTFLIRLYNRLKYLNRNLKHEEVLSRIWGIDIGKFPAELSTINLFRQSVSNFENFPRIINKDIFDVFQNDKFDFPPQNAGFNYVKVKENLPSFYGMVGNFPFIRQELIEKKIKGYKKTITKTLAKDYLFDFPELFTIKNSNVSQSITNLEINDPIKQHKFIENLIDKDQLELQLSGQADIYSYIFLHTTSLLENEGSMAIITSNSWLDVAYGKVLKNFILQHFKIKMIVASWKEPWFEDVAVNTIFTVLEKCQDENERNTNKVKFVKLKKTLKDLIGFHDLQIDFIRRWHKLDSLIRVIETSEYNAKNLTNNINTFENEDFRIRIVQQRTLLNEVVENKELSKWGKYLRAPDIYFEIIDNCKDKLVKLSEIASVKFGIKTGINDFFYLEPIEIVKDNELAEPSSQYLVPGLRIKCKNSVGWQGEIESIYLRKIFKSPKESASIEIHEDTLKYFIFICDRSIKELKNVNHFGALNYIEWGEKQRTSENKPWPEVPSVQGRKNWWTIDIRDISDFLWPKAFGDRFPIFKNDNLLSADRLYEIFLKNPKNKNKLAYLLNSSIQNLFIEVNGRINLGDGALDNMTYEAENCYVIDPDKITKIPKNQEFQTREIKNINDEIKKKDRILIDTEILKQLKLDPSVYLTRIYGGLTEIINERINLPQLRKKQKKQKIKVSFDDVKKSVIEEIIGKKLKLFPEAFYLTNLSGQHYEDQEFTVLNTSGSLLKAERFIGEITVKDIHGQVILKTYDEEIAAFLIKLAKSGRNQLKIPSDHTIIYGIINNYNTYISHLKEQLELNANQKLHSWNEAERMTAEIMNELDLNPIINLLGL